MPTSHWNQLNEIVGSIIKVNPNSMLDIGVGFGKFGVLAREYLELWDGRNKYNDWKRRIDGIEIFEQYDNPLYKFVYNNIYFGDALTTLPKINFNYDLILLIDVIEHFNKSDGYELINLCLQYGKQTLLSTPHNVSNQKDAFDNQHESHLSSWKEVDLPYNKVIIPNKQSLIALFG